MDATFSFKDDDFVKVSTGKMNPQIAFIRFVSIPLNPSVCHSFHQALLLQVCLAVLSCV